MPAKPVGDPANESVRDAEGLTSGKGAQHGSPQQPGPEGAVVCHKNTPATEGHAQGHNMDHNLLPGGIK